MMGVSHPTVAFVLNCEEYLNYHELPSDWCDNLSPWAICGIANGVIGGKGYGCFLWPNLPNQTCGDINSHDECTQFLQESDFESEGIEPEGIEAGDVKILENLLVVFIIIPVLYLLVCCFLCWKMSRSEKRNEWNLEGGRQQRVDCGQSPGSSGMSVLQKQSVEVAVEMVEPTPGDAIANSTPLQHLQISVVGETPAGEDLIPIGSASHGYKAPPLYYELPPPKYEEPPPKYEATPPYCETSTQL